MVSEFSIKFSCVVAFIVFLYLAYYFLDVSTVHSILCLAIAMSCLSYMYIIKRESTSIFVPIICALTIGLSLYFMYYFIYLALYMYTPLYILLTLIVVDVVAISIWVWWRWYTYTPTLSVVKKREDRYWVLK